MLLQTNLAESQQSFSAKEDQVQDLTAQLGSAQASAADLTKRKEETEAQLHQQKALLEQVQAYLAPCHSLQFVSRCPLKPTT